MLACSVVGGTETVRRGLNDLVAQPRADELMIVSDVFDFSKRLRSLEIVAEAAGVA
jgi:alkanesulfonate monooxygenase SsuD/methylene tetrahydromethanopterin reductase-like flavin-dependent oxidoreductase (luciferase family)